VAQAAATFFDGKAATHPSGARPTSAFWGDTNGNDTSDFEGRPAFKKMKAEHASLAETRGAQGKCGCAHVREEVHEAGLATFGISGDRAMAQESAKAAMEAEDRLLFAEWLAALQKGKSVVRRRAKLISFGAADAEVQNPGLKQFGEFARGRLTEDGTISDG
ncbi:unnamed protein product, partial [Prorocentrum cordatum]